ncbi:alanine racemase [Romboutsia lituseburensis]|uniref:Alanine racemase n=1 Tax=Romboutsia lituseburensis DSM 797 TaxID=1121325 RepID=A0A1G9L7H7_9FIRM|nr:alanine racemase [Romboutsia lituseburensis]CEH35202.1 Alanine racemase 2 [Romboutsia lituseburensis]SDL57920.1 alanine racemase [Romboutsia lituseburensis DSM 797]
MEKLRPTWVEINIDNLIYNIKSIKKFIGSNVKLGAVIKANAYGHGSIEIAKYIDELDIDYLCVASLQEARELRKNNIKKPILVMGYVPVNNIETAIKYDITITVLDYNYFNQLKINLNKLNKKCKVHIKIDTGFNRLGFKVNGNLQMDTIVFNQLLEIINSREVDVEGIFSHLSLTNESMDQIQFDRFLNTLKNIPNKNIIAHICDSIGMCKYKNYHMNMVRVGSCLYGYNSRSSELKLKKVMTFKSKIIQVKLLKKGESVSYDSTFIAPKDMKIGIVACGYADGIPRELSNKGYVMIGSKKCSIIGMICMDQTVIDLDNIDESMYGDDVIFYGERGPNLSEVCCIAKTNKNEILTRVSKRVIKVYINKEGTIKVVDELN